MLESGIGIGSMVRRDPAPRSRLALGLAFLAAGALPLAAGCDRLASESVEGLARAIDGGDHGGDVLRIASPWPRSTRDQLEKDFLAWLAAGPTGAEALPVTARCVWIDVEPGEPLETPGGRPVPADLLLGGPVREYVRRARAGKLAPVSLPGKTPEDPSWIIARRSLVVPMGGEAGGPGRPAFDDPRVSPPTLAWAAGQLRGGSWNEGYARLVRLFGRSPHRPGWRAGSAQAAVERGEADTALNAFLQGTGGKPEQAGPESVPFEEGAAVTAGARAGALARGFVEFLVERDGAGPGTDSDWFRPEVDDLLADLLGATLVDAREELVSAWTELNRAVPRDVSSPLLWMTEPPPWPPASVEKIRARGGENAEAMLADLAGQIGADPETKLALLQSWLRPRRGIDDTVLTELAGLASGRLVNEPRFRSWLRAEWTAWARQRYRRVARLASGAFAGSGPRGAQGASP
jgi:hypothetical protein